MNEEEIQRYFRDLVAALRMINHSIWVAETASGRLNGPTPVREVDGGLTDGTDFAPAISALYTLRTKLELKAMEMQKDSAQMGIVLQIPLA